MSPYLHKSMNESIKVLYGAFWGQRFPQWALIITFIIKIILMANNANSFVAYVNMHDTDSHEEVLKIDKCKIYYTAVFIKLTILL